MVLGVLVVLFMSLELWLVMEVDPVFAVLDEKMPGFVVTDNIEDVDVTPALEVILVDAVFGGVLLRVEVAFVEAGGVDSVEVAGLVLDMGLLGFEADVVDPNETEDVDVARVVLGILLVGIEVRTVGADEVSGVGVAEVGLGVMLLEAEMVAVGAKDVDAPLGAHCLFMMKFTPRRKEHAGGLEEVVSAVAIPKLEDVVEMLVVLGCVGNTLDVTLGALVVLDDARLEAEAIWLEVIVDEMENIELELALLLLDIRAEDVGPELAGTVVARLELAALELTTLVLEGAKDDVWLELVKRKSLDDVVGDANDDVNVRLGDGAVELASILVEVETGDIWLELTALVLDDTGKPRLELGPLLLEIAELDVVRLELEGTEEYVWPELGRL